MMPERLQKIIDEIKFDPKDNYVFADRVVHFMQNEDLWNEDNNFEFLRVYIKDTLEFDKISIEYHQKYTNSIFHKNTWRSLEFEDAVWKQILEKLEN